MKYKLKKGQVLLSAFVIITLLAGGLSKAVYATGGGFDSSFETGLPAGILDTTLNTGSFQYSNGDGSNWQIDPSGTKMAILHPTTPAHNYAALKTNFQMIASDITYIDTNFDLADANNPSKNYGITNGAYLYADVVLSASEVYQMAWNYSSTDYVPYNDGSFATFVNLNDPSNIPLIDNVRTGVSILGATVPGTGNYTTGSYGSTGWQTITFKANAAGTYRIGFTVFNISDTSLSPYLFIDDTAGATWKDGVEILPVTKDQNAPAPAGIASHTVTYDFNYGSGTVPSDSNTYASGATVTIASGNGLSKSGATFTGWSLTRDGSTLSGTTFSMPDNDVTLYAVWTPNATVSTGSTNVVTTDTRTAQVNGVNTEDAASVSTVDITRTENSGRTTDSVSLDKEKTDEVLQKVLGLGKDIMQIFVDGNNGNGADEVAINVNAASVSSIASNNVSLQVKTDDIEIQLPGDALSAFSETGTDLYFRLVPLKSEAEKNLATSQVCTTGLILTAAGTNQVTVLSTPMTIETNYQNYSANLVFPLTGINLPQDAAERDSFLNNVGMFINHEDGTQELLKGTIIYNSSGYPIGISIPVSHFSTFTMIKFDSLNSYVYNTHMKLGVIKSKHYANKVADIYRTEYNTANVSVVKKGTYYVVSADFASRDAADQACKELIAKKVIINYYLNFAN